jgi:hypothetical protein
MLLILKLLRARVEEASAEKQIPRRCARRNDKLSDAWCLLRSGDKVKQIPRYAGDFGARLRPAQTPQLRCAQDDKAVGRR